jgi:hypothetical protein
MEAIMFFDSFKCNGMTNIIVINALFAKHRLLPLQSDAL